MDSQQPLLGLKGMVLQNEGKSYTNGAVAWNKHKVQIKRESGRGGLVVKSKGSPRRVLKKRAGPPTRRRRDGSIRRRVRTLKRLVPSSGDSTGLDGLFRETADYILSLQSRVRLMQVMVQALAGSDDQE